MSPTAYARSDRDQWIVKTERKRRGGGQHVLTHHEHVSTWTASVYTVHVKMFPRGSDCVYIVHVVHTIIRNYLAKPRRSCFEFHVYSLCNA